MMVRRDARSDAPALVEGSAMVRYGELRRRVATTAARVAMELENMHIARDERWVAVAVDGSPTIETAVQLHALFALGVTAVPLHPKLTGRERAHALEAAQVRLELGRTDAESPRADRIETPRFGTVDRPLAVIFTSGSSGAPKPVVLSRRAMVAAARASEANLEWRNGDRWLCSLSPAHVGGLSILTRCGLGGRAVVFGTPGSFDAEVFSEDVRTTKTTLISIVPTMARALLTLPALPPVRAALIGGAPADEDLLAEANARGFPLLTTYGMSETSAQACTERPGERLSNPRGSGRPLPGVDIRICDGEICIAGPTLFDGYLEPDGTLDRPMDDEGYFHTGDLGHFGAHGQLFVEGRRDHRIISGGENVAPEEVEGVLRGVAGIEAVCVVGVPDPRWGERLVAVVVGHPEEAPMRQALVDDLAAFKRPKEFFSATQLPRTGSGKIDRRATRHQVLARKLVRLFPH
ncbi:MAG: class I adenylate-forming enzyme family protein [Myxococcota bacterium]